MGFLDRFRSRPNGDGDVAATRVDADRERGGERQRGDADRDRDLAARDRAALGRDRDAGRDAGFAAARERYGGLDIPATLVGMLTALAMLMLLGGLIGAAIGAIGYQTGLEGEEIEDISIASFIGGAITLFIAFLIGGWAAGRMARYDGGRNGLMTAVWALILAAILSALAAAFGDKYDVLRNVNLPQWFSQDALTIGGIISAIVAIAIMLVAGYLGGLWGAFYHRRVDRAIATT